MLVDSRTLNDAGEIKASIAIIGGGAAGITLAIELAKNFTDVVVIESGGLELEEQTQKLCDGPVLGHGNTDLISSRLRFLGGSTNHWNGQCAPLDAVDFEQIPGRPYSGWPFKREALTPFYQRAYSYCRLGTYRSDSPASLNEFTSRRFVDSPQFDLAEFRLSRPPTAFGRQFRHDLESSDRIKVYLHGNVTDFSVADGDRSISAAQVKTLSGQHYSVKAAAFVLCCGGIENPRILLNCTGRFPKGLGNDNDLVGRFFMDHLSVEAGDIVPLTRIPDFEMYHKHGNTVLRAAFKNSAETVRRSGRAGCSIIPYPQYENAAEGTKARANPSVTAAKEIFRYARRGRLPPQPVENGCTVLNDVSVIAMAAYYSTQMGRGSLTSLTAMLEGEQTPNPESRVVLVEERDMLGMRRAGLHWQISHEDRNNLFETTMELARGVGATGFGRMATDIKPGNDQSMIGTAWHHMGTTRMHDDRRQGVVDRNCRVHQIENLFVAGSSVFPTGGRANPTVTIVALAIRLADHLKLTVKSA